MLAKLFALLVLLNAAFYVSFDWPVFSLPKSIGWAASAGLLVVSSFLSWASLSFWGQHRLAPNESFSVMIERMGGGLYARGLRVVLAVFCLTNLVRIAGRLLELTETFGHLNSSDLVVFYAYRTICVLLMLAAFNLKISSKAHSIMGSISVVLLVLLLVVKVKDLVVYGKLPVCPAFVFHKILDLTTAWSMASVLSIGVLMPLALPDVCHLFNIPDLPPTVLAIAPQLLYGLMSTLAWVPPATPSDLSDYLLLHLYFIFAFISGLNVLSLILRSWIDSRQQPVDDVEAGNKPGKSKAVWFLLGLSGLAFLAVTVLDIWKQKVLAQIPSTLPLIFLGLPMALLFITTAPLWIACKKRDCSQMAILSISSVIAVLSVGQLYTALVKSILWTL